MTLLCFASHRRNVKQGALCFKATDKAMSIN
jgi:hypothetical protein